MKSNHNKYNKITHAKRENMKKVKKNKKAKWIEVKIKYIDVFYVFGKFKFKSKFKLWLLNQKLFVHWKEISKYIKWINKINENRIQQNEDKFQIMFKINVVCKKKKVLSKNQKYFEYIYINRK